MSLRKYPRPVYFLILSPFLDFICFRLPPLALPSLIYSHPNSFSLLELSLLRLDQRLELLLRLQHLPRLRLRVRHRPQIKLNRLLPAFRDLHFLQ